MKERIIEIVEIGQPQSLIQRKNALITELIKTDLLIEELNEQLRLYNVVGRREQLISFFNWYKDDPKELSNNETIVDAYLKEINYC